MASRTQIRLQQITGSFGNAEGKIRDDIGADATLAGIKTTDLTGSLGIIASSIKRIVGGAGANAFSAVAASTLKDVGNTDRITYIDSAATILRGPTGNADLTVADALVTVADDLTVSGGDVVLGDAANADNTTIKAADESGTDVAGKSLTIKAGASTGNASGGSLIFQATAAGGSSGTSVNSHSTQLTIEHNLSTFAADVKVEGGDIEYGNSGNANLKIEATAHNAAGKNLTISAGSTTAGTTNDIAGGALIFQGGQGKGTGAGGAIQFKVAGAAGSSANTLNSLGTALTIGSDGNVTAAGNVTITGDLDVNGTTTTIDTANLQVEDSIIGLGISGSNNEFTNVGDRAIIFCRSANQHDALPALNWNGSSFEMATYLAKPGSGSLGDPQAVASLLANLALPDSAGDHTLTLQADGDDLSQDRTLDFIVADSGGTDADRTLHIEANVVKLDQDYTVDASVQFAGLDLSDGNLTNGGDIDADSISVSDAANGLNIDGSGANTGTFKITLKDNVANGLDIVEGGQSFLRFITTDGGSPDDTQKVELGRMLDLNGNLLILDVDGDTGIAASTDDIISFNIAGTDELHLSASALSPHADDGLSLGRAGFGFSDAFLASGGVLNFDNGNVTLTHAANKLTLLADKDLKFGADSVGISNGTDGSNPRLELTSNSQTFLFPSARAGASGEAIVGDGSGNLSFAEVGKVTTKGVYAMTASHAAQVAFKTSTNGNRITATDAISGIEESDAQGKNLDVYVNGQLLSSGSSFSGAAAATTDYMIADDTNIAFSFDLEVEDIVQIVKRG